MNTAIGITSARSDQRLARVWNRKLPIPTAAVTRISQRAAGSRPPARRHSTSPQAAASRKAPFETALSGSDQKLASTRSQYLSIGCEQVGGGHRGAVSEGASPPPCQGGANIR